MTHAYTNSLGQNSVVQVGWTGGETDTTDRITFPLTRSETRFIRGVAQVLERRLGNSRSRMAKGSQGSGSEKDLSCLVNVELCSSRDNEFVCGNGVFW